MAKLNRELPRGLGAELTLAQHEMRLRVGKRAGQAGSGSEGLLPRNAS
jgi:hypothetical protein